MNPTRDFDWNHTLWAVVKADGRFAGSPCLNEEEARLMAAEHPGAQYYKMERISTPIYCPNGFCDCPYCDADGACNVGDPMEECDDYYAAMGDDE